MGQASMRSCSQQITSISKAISLLLAFSVGPGVLAGPGAVEVPAHHLVAVLVEQQSEPEVRRTWP